MAWRNAARDSRSFPGGSLIRCQVFCELYYPVGLFGRVLPEHDRPFVEPYLLEVVRRYRYLWLGFRGINCLWRSIHYLSTKDTINGDSSVCLVPTLDNLQLCQRRPHWSTSVSMSIRDTGKRALRAIYGTWKELSKEYRNLERNGLIHASYSILWGPLTATTQTHPRI